jgi:Tfp pilus assembly protein FimT
MRTISLPELVVILAALSFMAVIAGVIVWAVVRGKRA